MSTTIKVRPAALDQAVADVSAAARLLHESAETAERQVTGLLSDWQGAAADSFADAFDEWRRAAAACLAALDDLGAGLGVTRAAFVTSDDAADRQLGRVAVDGRIR